MWKQVPTSLPFALLALTSSLCGQDALLSRARALLDKGDHEGATGIITERLSVSPDSVDWRLLHVELCLARGDLDNAVRARQQLVAAYSERLRLIDERMTALRGAKISAKVGGRSEVGSERPSSDDERREGAPTGSGVITADPADAGADGGIGSVAAAEQPPNEAGDMPEADGERLRRAMTAAAKELRVGNGEQAREIMETAFRSVEGRPRANWGKAAEAAGSSEPEVAQAGRAALARMLLELARQIVARWDGMSAAEQEADLATFSQIASTLGKLEEHERAAEAVHVLAKSLHGTAAALRVAASVLDGWAATLEAPTGPGGDIEARSEALFRWLVRFQGEGLTSRVAERCATGLAQSVVAEVSSHAKQLLVRWAEQHLARAEAYGKEGAVAKQAREYEAAFECDSGNRDRLFDAAELYRGLGEKGEAVRLYKKVAEIGTSDRLVRASAAQLQGYWAESKANLQRSNLDKSLPASKGEWLQALASFEELLPVMSGPELTTLRSMVEADQLKAASDRVVAYFRELRTGQMPQLQSIGELDDAPRVGSDYDIPALDLALRWVPADGDAAGFWCGKVLVDVAIWTTLDRWNIVQMANPCPLSWYNANALADALTDREEQAKRLPPGYVYGLPTMRELDRIRSEDQRLPFGDVDAVWTCEVGEGLGTDYKPNRRAGKAGGPGHVDLNWATLQVLSRVGTVLVLKRR